jgi:hypothetical protein
MRFWVFQGAGRLRCAGHSNSNEPLAVVLNGYRFLFFQTFFFQAVSIGFKPILANMYFSFPAGDLLCHGIEFWTVLARATTMLYRLRSIEGRDTKMTRSVASRNCPALPAPTVLSFLIGAAP